MKGLCPGEGTDARSARPGCRSGRRSDSRLACVRCAAPAPARARGTHRLGSRRSLALLVQPLFFRRQLLADQQQRLLLLGLRGGRRGVRRGAGGSRSGQSPGTVARQAPRSAAAAAPAPRRRERR